MLPHYEHRYISFNTAPKIKYGPTFYLSSELYPDLNPGKMSQVDPNVFKPKMKGIWQSTG